MKDKLLDEFSKKQLKKVNMSKVSGGKAKTGPWICTQNSEGSDDHRGNDPIFQTE